MTSQAQSHFPFAIDKRFEYRQHLSSNNNVYLAYDHKLQRLVALKFITDNSSQNLQQIQAQVKHQNVCQIYEVYQSKQHTYLVMQYVSGQSLQQLAGKLSLSQHLQILEQVLRGLYQAHNQGICHNHISATHVLVENTNNDQYTPYLIGFDHSDDHKGVVDDIYDLGVMLFELIDKQFPTLPHDLKQLLDKWLNPNINQRYHSAQLIADELRRYLNGEPIESFGGFSYRMKKRLNKNKLLTLAFAITLLTLFTSGGVLLWQQQQQIQRQQLIETFAAEVENMEADVRLTYMSPAHQISAKLSQWQTQINNLEQQIQTLGAIAQGPGHYAIGRMYYSLQHYEQALAHLQLSIAAGFNDPRVVYVLALTHGALYQRLKNQIDNQTASTTKQTKLAKLDSTHRQPAITLLEQGMTASPYQRFAKAKLLYYQQQYQQALEQLHQPDDFPPWFYRHHELKGDIYLALAENAKAAHKHIELTRFSELALQHYRQAIEIAPSDFHLLLKPVHLYISRLNTILYGGQGNFEYQYHQGLAFLEKAIKVNPQHYLAFFLKGNSLAIKSQYEDQYSGTPIKTLTLAIAQLLQANRKAPDNAAVSLALALAYKTEYKLLQSRGFDGAEQLIKGIRALEQVTASAHDHAYYSTYGSLLQARALWLAKHNQANYAEYFARAVKAFSQASSLQPTAAGPLINSGSTLRFWANQLNHQAAKEKLQLAITKYQQAKQLNQKHFVATYYLGLSYAQLAKLNNQRLEDPKQSITLAQHYLQQALTLGNQHPFVVNELAILKNTQAIYLWQQGLPYQTLLAQGIELLEQSLELHPNNHILLANRAGCYFTWYQLNHLSAKTTATLFTQTQQAIALALQHSSVNRHDQFMLKLMSQQEILSAQIDKIEDNTDEHLLLRALWHSKHHRFEQADGYFAKITNIPLSILWVYRYQHLQRWLRQATTPATIQRLSNELRVLTNKLSTHYPALKFQLI